MEDVKDNRPFPDSFLQELLSGLAEEQQYILLENNRLTTENRHSYLFTGPEERLAFYAGDAAADFFAEIESRLASGYYVAGWFAYEFGYVLDPVLSPLLRQGRTEPLACLWCYRNPLIHDHLASVPAPPAWPRRADPGDLSYRLTNLHVAERKEDYLANILRIKQYIAAGDTYQVNYTGSLRFDFAGSPEGLYRELRRNQGVSYGAVIKDGSHHILSLSPELFFRIREREITVRPMKGTVRRAGLPSEDKALKSFLQSDVKNRSENVMIVDLLRNDLGRVCARPSVETASLFDVESYETLHQMTSTVRGRLDAGCSWLQLFRALFPCGSVTGAPKIRTMEIIRELESGPRGVYTGAIGFIAPGGDAVFNVPIRTVVLEGDKGRMGIGSGVVFDSEPEQEWHECLLKGKFLSDPLVPYQLIETLYWHPDSGFWLLAGHLDRLAHSARHLGFACARRQVEQALADEVGRYAGQSDGRRVRLLLAKDGTMQVSSAVCPPPAMDLLPPPVDPATLPAVSISSESVRSDEAFLYHKTTRREVYDEERRRADREGLFEILFVNERGELTEGAISNLFVRRQDCFLTPPLRCGLLNGVFRQHFLRQSPLPVKEQVVTPKDLEEAEAIYIGNSVRGLVQVALLR